MLSTGDVLAGTKMNRARLAHWRFTAMSTYRIFYLRGGLLDDTEELVSDDLFAATQTASSRHPDLTAEIWCHDRKVAVILPCREHRAKLPSEVRMSLAHSDNPKAT